MKLIHYAPAEIALDTSRQYPQTPSPKPAGLWVSVGRAWRDWCEANAFRLEEFDFPHRVLIPKTTRMLRLNRDDAIDVFTRAYGVDICRGVPGFIDWPRVAAEYDGILCAPYIYSRRLHIDTTWYYGWDCASGCIWRLAGVRMAHRPGHQDDEGD